MAFISQAPLVARLSSIFIATFILCVFQIVQVEEESSSILQLPSEASDEGSNLCTGAMLASCPIKCFRADLVCSIDVVTYWYGCMEAAYAGAKVAKLRFCEVGSRGSDPLSSQALLLVHILWLIVLGFSVFFGLF